ncbi:thiolase family protein [Hydrogenophaga laconesensis]|uniref:Acetyl-CoA acetyltransferase n=1 Tax=Hydrogenophaga laconesensis TaxID=1805971 RepID=A0ABU1V958_9BURK|nr:thiolase family protein [Hydrogenophaga laconesensis]MDR7093989.1 acetyl-CoA acetyltransferase [Hydrogenophaga laconesensis]
MSHEVYIVGVGMTPTGKFADTSLHQLTATAVRAALADAGATARDVDMACFSNVAASYLQGQHMVAGQVVLRDLGILGVPIINVENACASASTAFWLACQSVRSGSADMALAVGAEKLFHADRAKSFEVFGGGFDVTRQNELLAYLARLNQAAGVPMEEGASSERSIFMDIYAALAVNHMQRHGLTQRQLAVVASKNHAHSVHNPLAQYRRPWSVDEVLAGRAITYPLTLPMCAPIGDGAAAVLVCNAAGLQRLPGATPVAVLACELVSGLPRSDDDAAQAITHRAALAAYECAGLGPADVDVAEVHDATAFGEVLQTEALGFCAPGDGGRFAESGATSLGGSLPVNVSGGLESKGHPIGATGLMQIGELTQQLRGRAGPRQVDGARVALAENGGGFIENEEAVACVTLLGTARPGRA